MGSGRRMDQTQLWLLASLAFFSVISHTRGSPLILKICKQEKKQTNVSSSSIPTDGVSSYWVQIPPAGFSRDPSMRQYVYLQAYFPDVRLEKVVLVSFHSGYMFIQTDKTLYTPSSRVHFRVFGLMPRLEPVDRDAETRADAFINIEFVLISICVCVCAPVCLSIRSIGLWKVVTRFHNKPQMNFSAKFEIKEYVLPSFEVKLRHGAPSTTCTIPSSPSTSQYLFGEEVDGSAYGVFGVMYQGQKRSFPSSLQRVQIVKGKGEVTLKREHIIQTFENILELVGRSIYVAVSVLTDSGKRQREEVCV
uniref:Macroglobulin domain-containing protein n=1 Tax=Stegastes partitus TaxID=144197 RepID=A0A3B4ZJX6_9TELE